MKSKIPLIFWVIVFAVLTLLFSAYLDSLTLSFYFVSFLFPVVIGTSLFFNRFLVPRYLIRGRYWKFGLYFAYLLIVSIYLEMLVIVLAFVILADYRIENLGGMTGDIYVLTATLYLVVFISGFIAVFRGLRQRDREIDRLEAATARNAREILTVKIDRKNTPIEVGGIAVIESLSDYVRIHTTAGEFITRQKISALEAQLPDQFLRIHRSFLVNRDHISSYGRESVTALNREWPVGRKYRASAMKALD